MFKKGMRVVCILQGGGVETATVREVVRASKGRLQLDGDEHTWFDRDGAEIGPAIPGFYKRLVTLEE